MMELKFIAGSGRSGTTWVLDSLAKANGLRPVFEPLNPYASQLGRMYAHRALAAEDSHPQLREFLEQVIAGREVRLWTKFRRQKNALIPARTSDRPSINIPKVMRNWALLLKEGPGLTVMSMRSVPLVKCIWSNLMLGWLARQFHARMVFLVRHPGAVIESELRNKWNPDPVLARINGDERFHELTQERYRKLLARPKTLAEGLATRWLIENQWVIETAPSIGVTIAFYEHLAALREDAWQQVRVGLGLVKLPSEDSLLRPSQQSDTRDLKDLSGQSIYSRWQNRMTGDQKSRIQAVLDEAQFDVYSLQDAEPRATGSRERSTTALER